MSGKHRCKNCIHFKTCQNLTMYPLDNGTDGTECLFYEEEKSTARTCIFGCGVTVRPDGVHELSPHAYKLTQKLRNVTVEVLTCETCGDCYFATETGCRLEKSTAPMGKNPTATKSCNSECVKYRIIEDPNGLSINPQLFRLLSRYSGDPRGAEGIPGNITDDLGGALLLLNDCRDRIIYGPDDRFVCLPKLIYDFCIEQIEKELGQKRRTDGE